MSLYRDIRNIMVPPLDEGEASAIAFMLLERVAGIDKMHALMGDDSPQRDTLAAMARRIAQGEPAQYVMGEAEFCGLTFRVAPGVLIPRTETEELVDWVSEGRQGGRLLDIGTGSGCIAVSLAHLLPEARVSAWDVSDDALRIAEGNARLNAVGVEFAKVDVLALAESLAADTSYPLPTETGALDVIVSNPPYICHSEKAEMEDVVLSHEPHLALFVPDDDPLLFYRAIARLGLIMLKDRGELYFEINRMYGAQTVTMLETMGYTDVELRRDQFENDRMVRAIKP